MDTVTIGTLEVETVCTASPNLLAVRSTRLVTRAAQRHQTQ